MSNLPVGDRSLIERTLFVTIAMAIAGMYVAATGLHRFVSWLFHTIGKVTGASAINWTIGAESLTGLVLRCIAVAPCVIVNIVAYAILEPIAVWCALNRVIVVRAMEIMSDDAQGGPDGSHQA